MTGNPLHLDNLLTEQRNPRTMDIDELSTREILTRINQEDDLVPLAIGAQLESITSLVEAVESALRRGGRLIYIGAGTSGRLGVLDASECPPTFGTDPSQVVGLIAGGDRALRDSIEDAEDDPSLGRAALVAINLTQQDIVIGIAASGRTPYTVGALQYANELGAATGCVVNTPGSILAHTAVYPIVIHVGPEVITGSTRLKSGTAQKMILNMITTAVMIRLGKVYSNLMVDVQPDNEKLLQRATNIIVELTDANPDEARQALQRYGSAKAAIFALLTGLQDDQVHNTLARHDGHLRNALKASEI
jgi:N-acetylmuramic acid 6-phosphate etherase